MKTFASWMDEGFASFLFCAMSILLALLAGRAQADEGWNVILLTLDGVRTEEFFHGVRFPRQTTERGPAFPRFWEQTASRALILGDDDSPMTVSNRYSVSLPGYQSIFTGRDQGTRCRNNGRLCLPLREPTFLERATSELSGSFSDVAVIASWTEYRRAVAKKPDSFFVNAGQDPMIDPEAPSDIPESLVRLNHDQKKNLAPWAPTRSDQFTFDYALWYLKAKHPRLLVIGLNDADELAHRGKYDTYFKTLRKYDEWIERLLSTLKQLGDYGRRTALVVTTDHGRGRGVFWSQHARVLAASAWVWAFMVPPEELTARFVPRDSRSYAHADLRPTIETLLGLAPQAGPGRSWIESKDLSAF